MTTVPWDVLVAKAKTEGFTEVAPVGSYQCRIESAEAGESSQKKTPQIDMRLKITEGEHAGKRPTTFSHRIYMTEANASIFMQNLNAFGITNEVAVQHRPTLDQIARAIVGKVVTVVTQEAKRDGVVQLDRDNNPQIEVKWSLKAPQSGAVAVTSFPPVGGGYAAPGGSTEDPGF
jgi:Protein of unknown function (DUF669)